MRRQVTGSFFKKFTKYERNYLSLDFLEEDNHQLGGKLTVSTNEWNFSQLASHNYNQYGYFTDDKLVFGKFINSTEENPTFDDILNPSINSSSLIVRHNYEMSNGVLQYRMEINPNLVEKHHEDISTANEDNSIESEIVPILPLAWTQRLFLELGKNK